MSFRLLILYLYSVNGTSLEISGESIGDLDMTFDIDVMLLLTYWKNNMKGP